MIHRLGPFRLDSELDILFMGADPIPLGRRAVALLRALVERAGAPVSKDLLLETAWPGLTVEEANLSVQIAALRRMLDKAPGGRDWIETMPRRGYRFIGPVGPDSATDDKRTGNGAPPDVIAPAPFVGPYVQAHAERRQLTIMSCECDFPTGIDLEDLRAAINAFHRWVTVVAFRFSGSVVRRLTNGVRICFGYPIAYENNAERAVLAGLEFCEGFADGPSGRLPCRVGIATGAAIVGNVLTFDEGRDEVLIGDAVALSERLQTSALPGALLIDGETKRLIGDLFVYREAPLVGDLPAAWQVLGASIVGSRFEALRHSALTPLVGRDEERALLERRWTEAQGGHGRVVLIAGDPGFGKSRLIAALEPRARGQGAAIVQYNCGPLYANSPFHPIIAQLRQSADFAREDTAEAKFAKLQRALAQTMRTASETSLLAELLSLPVPGPPPPPMDPARRKRMTLGTLVAHVAEVARHGPMLLIFEDVHWIDPSSLEFLSLAIERLRSLPALVLITYRPTEFKPPWSGDANVTTLTLNRLDETGCRELVRLITDLSPLAETLVNSIVERTDGVPLFVEEVTKAVLEESSGAVSEPAAAHTVPATLSASLMARLDRLGQARQIAQVCAVIGREFPNELLAAVSPLSDQETNLALSQLAEAGLVARRAAAAEATFAFRHALIQAAAYESLLRDERQKLHASIAQALETKFPNEAEAEPAVVAHHFEQAGVPAKAIAYWLKAGVRTIHRSANLETINHLQNGLRLLDTVAAMEDRAELELELQLALGQALIAVYGYTSPRTTAAFARAEHLVGTAGGLRQRYSALYGNFASNLIAGRLEAATSVVQRFHRLASQGDDTVALAVAFRLLGNVSFFRGDLAAANAELEKAVELYGSEQRRDAAFYFGPDTATAARIFLAMTQWLRGQQRTAFKTAQTALAAAREIGHAQTVGQTLALSVQLRYMAHDSDALYSLAAESQEFCERNALHYFGAVSRFFWLWAQAQRAEPGSFVDEFRGALATYVEMGCGLQLGLFRCMLARLLIAAGKPEEAANAAERAVDDASAAGERWWLPELHRTRAEALLLAGETYAEKAEKSLRAAIAEAHALGAPSLEVRAAVALARLLARRSVHAEGRKILAPLVASFAKGFEIAELATARATLDELGKETDVAGETPKRNPPARRLPRP